jgi:hypothetical protein
MKAAFSPFARQRDMKTSNMGWGGGGGGAPVQEEEEEEEEDSLWRGAWTLSRHKNSQQGGRWAPVRAVGGDAICQDLPMNSRMHPTWVTG